jgi:hypothetical protein
MCVLWNLSVDEKLRAKMANSELLSALIQALTDDKVGVKEAAAGVLANLAMSECNHCVMVEAGVIPKLVIASFIFLSGCHHEWSTEGNILWFGFISKCKELGIPKRK